MNASTPQHNCIISHENLINFCAAFYMRITAIDRMNLVNLGELNYRINNRILDIDTEVSPDVFGLFKYEELSLRKRIKELTNYVSDNQNIFHIIILNETRLRKHEIDNDNFNLPGYISHHSTREKEGGGVSIFVLKSFSQTNEISNFEFENSNFLIVNLVKYNLKIGGFYKPPNSNVENFLSRLDLVESNGYKILNSLAHDMFTRQDPVWRTRSCIDHIFTDTFSHHDKIIKEKLLLNSPTDSFNSFLDYFQKIVSDHTINKSMKERFHHHHHQ
ncbi:CLUMA_CG014536, isoform A [Clunio marinus]|uniref:CLUMA_CG014536, isoform A n=1 Tax=Clunio marinus TaxID=568069 RepID=A0A1J1IT02_9DIPT|nr:CLUMA_CG014536, isoform A [Clunio marinus]